MTYPNPSLQQIRAESALICAITYNGSHPLETDTLVALHLVSGSEPVLT